MTKPSRSIPSYSKSATAKSPHSGNPQAKASRSQLPQAKVSLFKTSRSKLSQAKTSHSKTSHSKTSHSKTSQTTSSRKKQLELQGQGLTKPSDEFGGSLLKGHPKKARPLDSKLPVHLTLRARRSVLRLPKFFGKVQDVITEVSRKHGVKIYKQANVGNHLHLALKLPRKTAWAGFIRELTGRIALVCREKASAQRKRARRRALEIHARIAKGNDWHEDPARALGIRVKSVQGNGLHADLAKASKDLARAAESTARASGSRARRSEGGFWMVRPHTRLVRGWKKAFKTVLDYIHLNQLEAEGRIMRKDMKTLKEYRKLFVQGFVLKTASSG